MTGDRLESMPVDPCPGSRPLSGARVTASAGGAPGRTLAAWIHPTALVTCTVCGVRRRYMWWTSDAHVCGACLFDGDGNVLPLWAEDVTT